jgi:hypothetical protein
MVKLSEGEVREMLERRAREFSMASVPTDEILHRARRRKIRNVVLASATSVAVVALAGLAVGLQTDRDVGSAAGGDRLPSPAPTSARLRVVDYTLRDRAAADDPPHPTTGPRITLSGVLRHARCMRSQGFDVPAPTRQPGGGWAVILSPDKARRLTFGSRQFREAWFVTCGPLGGPLTGDLVVGGPRPKIDRFMSCMRRQGFDLPAPTKDASGHYAADEWQFDLAGTSIDTSTGKWNRAMFVTCAPDDI